MRLCRPQEFQRVFDAKRSVANGTLIVYAAPNQRSYSRLGLVVSKKIGNAVRRNRWKRLIREVFRESLDLPTGFDLVVLPNRQLPPTTAVIERSLRLLATRVARKWKR